MTLRSESGLEYIYSVCEGHQSRVDFKGTIIDIKPL